MSGKDGLAVSSILHSPPLHRPLIMSEDQGGFSKGKIDIEQLPDAIIRLVETMVGIDPNWDLEKWMSQQAEDYLQIIEKDLERERIILEQKIQRLQNLTSRINPAQKEADKGQKNLFDCFDISPPSNFKSLGERTYASNEQEPASNVEQYLDLIPGENTDDPLLAIVANYICVLVERKISTGSNFATLEEIFEGLVEIGIEVNEIDEALDFLLTNGELIEVDDDCFVTS